MKLELSDEGKALEKRIDDMFRKMWSGGMTELVPPAFRRLRETFAPSTNVFKRGDDLVTRIELPGIDPGKDLTVEVSDGELIVRGQRHESEEVKEEDFYRKEVWQGSYERRLRLPAGTSHEAVSAEYDKGVLEVIIHGAGREIEEPEKDGSKKIPVKVRS